MWYAYIDFNTCFNLFENQTKAPENVNCNTTYNIYTIQHINAYNAMPPKNNYYITLLNSVVVI